MAVSRFSNGKFAYVFKHEGKIEHGYPFKTERDAERAERAHRMKLSKPITFRMHEFEMDAILESLDRALNTVDVVFPSLIPGLRHAYEALSGKKFVPSVSNWMKLKSINQRQGFAGDRNIKFDTRGHVK